MNCQCCGNPVQKGYRREPESCRMSKDRIWCDDCWERIFSRDTWGRHRNEDIRSFFMPRSERQYHGENVRT